MLVNINQRQVDIPDGKSIYEAIEIAGENILKPELGQEKDWIKNPYCPLMGLAAVGDQFVPLPLLKARPAKNGASIDTSSPRVKEELNRRARMLAEQHECYFMRQWQKMIAAEGENAGFINMEEWENFSFEQRLTAPSIIHDPNKCIRCQACVETCRDIQEIGALSFDEKLGILVDDKLCVRCGQCIHHCPVGATRRVKTFNDFFNCHNCAFGTPMGAMHEVDDTYKAWDMLHDSKRYCVAQFAPAVRASLGEEFGIPAGELVTGKIYAALRRLGFKKVWDTNFAADLTIMEEGSEFIDRLTNEGCLPLFTSCSPGWIRFAETFYPELLPHISTAKSPQQMFGAVAKSFAAKSLNVSAESMYMVSIMPCTAKKFEAERPEMTGGYEYWNKQQNKSGMKKFPDIDTVLTTRELARLIKMAGIDLRQMPDEKADPLMGDYTGAAPIFGRTGGVMEAALRTVITLLSGQPPKTLEFNELGNLDGIKRQELKLGDKTLKVAVAHGLGNARKVCESVKSGGEFAKYHFIEFMTCPGGCIAGGGQPIPTNDNTKYARMDGLNCDDREVCQFRMSHENYEVKALYDSFLEKPLSHLAHELLHTSYQERHK